MKRTLKRGILAALTATALMQTSVSAHTPSGPFADVPLDSWYCEYVTIAADFGVINGRTETMFMPDDTITCAEAVKMAACAHASMHHYDIFDFTGDHWYDKYVRCCQDNGIIEPHVKLNMNKPATRAEIAYLFSRVDKTGMYINQVPITDIPDVDGDTPYYHEIMDMYEMGAATGDANMAFRPNDNVKRSEAAAMITRVMCYDLRIGLPKG